MRVVLPILLAGGAALSSTSANAQAAPPDNGPHGVVAIGAGVVPEYDGAEDLRAIPFVQADVHWGDINLEIRGLRARADLASDPRLSIGPVIGARLPRSDVDGPVGLLPDIDTAIEAGGFIGYRFGGDESGQGSLAMELSVVHDVSGVHDGMLATASASYAAVRRDDFFLSLDAQTTWVNQDYARTYFGVTPAGAAASGLAADSPGSGIKDVGVGVTAGYWFSERFGVTGRVGANYLVGDIADSPVTEEGRRWQPSGGLSIAYRF
ncbi:MULTISPECIES: MipA/OmpV family protein [Rhizobium/Agrobacterium group]|uniref:MipA/OmpV family protein n=1 Tax=Neorhizobium petrolearium TaxID=515361 RepID=A0ABY8M966_9HYPH|nr:MULTISPECIES: MipA/OmpV family protein [Rhizobium/Agrobacterium group]KGD98514.1 MipA family protein [Rhizobium sp. YS-1r]MCC2609774.1 MipA/OmpV family protein [Neorhizobium petrolearium]WGI69965.1 MipA/OmpV family protein [Neorhizobium petrolearium]